MSGKTRIPLVVPAIDDEMKTSVLKALQNDKYVMGENTVKFEEEFARYVGTKFGVSTSSGTHALHFSLIACNVKHGVSVATSPFSFVATSNAVVHAGGTPHFVDIDPDSCNINTRFLREDVRSRASVLLPVHLYGLPADMEDIMAMAKERNMMVVEDACQAHGAEFQGKKVGSIGDVGCFSFYPSKNMSVLGDGGMIVTNNDEIASSVSRLRDAGRKTRYEHDVVGFTSRLNSINAAVGRIQLKRLDKWNERRRTIADLYVKEMKYLDQVKLPSLGSSNVKHVFHLFVIRTERRNELKIWLEDRGVECGMHYPIPIHLQPAYRKLYGFKNGDFPFSEDASRKCLSLPMHPHLKDESVRFICEQIRAFYNR